MKINSLSIRNYVNFNAKHKDTRKADDLMRNANLAFPMFNPSYAYYFYNTINGESKEKQIAREKFEQGICQRFLAEVRRPSEYADRGKTCLDVPYAYLLDLLEKKKLGNCRETAIVTLCSLFANGYYNSQDVNLNLNYSFIDKNTGEILTSGTEEIDHCVVMTDFNNPKRKDIEDYIIIDPWLEYTGSMNEANGKYKMLFGEAIDYSIQNIAQEEEINLDDCIVKTSIFYTPSSERTQQEAIRVGRYVE